MAAAELLSALVEATLASSAAVLLILALRLPLQRGFGAGVAYALWWLVPVALLAVALPPSVTPVAWGGAAAINVLPAIAVGNERVESGIDIASWCLAGWGIGVLLSIGWAGAQQLNFLRSLGPLQRRDDGVLQARSVAGLPAVIGWWAPAIVVPADFDTRYSPQQCELMQAHERSHIRRGDLHWNLVATLLRALFWFNPLLHFAAQRFRDDQELACDARVIARHPHARRAYGEAMLKTQLAAQPLPLGCHWGQTHPLKERIAMLARPVPTFTRWLAGAGLTLSLIVGAGVSAWAMQPSDGATPMMPVVAEGQFKAQFRVKLNGKVVSSPSIINAFGKPFSLYSGTNGGQGAFTIDGTVSPASGGALRMAMKVYRDGVLVDSPTLMLKPGIVGAVAVGAIKGAAFEGVELDVLLSTSTSGNEKPLGYLLSARGSTTTRDNGLVSTPVPAYPASALASKVSGRVVLLVDVAANGQVTGAQVESSEPHGVFDATAIETVKKWRLKPELQDGKPVASRRRVPIDFSASGQPPVDKI